MANSKATTKTATPKVDYLIVGNSAAGISAAEAIRRSDAKGSIMMVSPEPYEAYGRPLISYLLEGKVDEAHLSYKDAGFYARNAIETQFGAGCAAVALDAAAHTVTLENGQVIGYKSVLVATGSIPFTPPIEGLGGRSNVYSFLTLDDAKQAWAAALAATEQAHAEGRRSRAVIIGAGLIGLKAAEALVHHVDDVIVLEMAPRILPAVLDDDGAAILADALRERGIVCMPGITADKVMGEGDCARSCHLTNGETLDFDFMVAAVGVRPNSQILIDAGAKVERGVVCDHRMRTSLPDVYAAGDVTQTVDVLDGAKRPLALWPNAVEQGSVAGAQMAGAKGADVFEGSFAVNAVDFFDLSLLTSGIINPDPADGYDVNVIVDGDAYAKFVTKDDRLFGYILLNRPDNAGIYTAVIRAATPISSLAGGFFDDSPTNIAFSDEDRWERLHRCYPHDLDDRGWKEVV